MTVAEAILYSTKKLASTTAQPTEHALWILEVITGFSRTQLLLNSLHILNDTQLKRINEWLTLITDHHMPIQYLIGSVPFAGVVIDVIPPLLIPRPETEELVMRLIRTIEETRHNGFRKSLTILDMCTGTGCIAIALAKAFPFCSIYASDISSIALETVNKNMKKNLVHNIQCFQSDLFTNIPTDITFDIIISNPPYISTAEWLACSDAVKKYEDKNALVAPKQGIAILEKIIYQAPQWLSKHSAAKTVPELLLETGGAAQIEKLLPVMQQAGFFPTMIKDMSGRARFVMGRRDHEALFFDTEPLNMPRNHH